MPLINCKVEIKFKWTKYYVLSAAGNDHDNDNDNNTIFTIKDTNFCVPVVNLSARENQKWSKLVTTQYGFEWICCTLLITWWIF